MGFSRHRKGRGFAKKRSKDDKPIYRLLIGALFVLILAVFIHFREERVELVEVGASAKGFIVARVSFEFPDPDATLVIKQEAYRDIGRIYQIDESEIKRIRYKFENYLIQHPNWRKGNNVTFEEMYNVLDVVTREMENAKLTDARTLRKREELGLSVRNYYIVTGLDAERYNRLPDSFWSRVSAEINRETLYSDYSINFVVDYFKDTRWRVQTDVDSQKIFQEIIEKQIPEKYTYIDSGTKILSEGEKITPRHLSMLKAMNQALRDAKNLWTVKTILSSILISLIVTVVAWLYFYFRKRDLLYSTRQLALYITIITLLFIASKLVEWFVLYAGYGLVEYMRYPIFIPFATIMLSVLMGEEIALFSSFVLTVILGITLAVPNNYFLFMNLITGTMAALLVKVLKKRKEIFVISAELWLTAACIIVVLNLGSQTLFTMYTVFDLIAAAINLVIMAILLVAILPMLESIFNIMTDMGLMEYMDPTSDLLQRLSIDAPGTYQHSLSIGHIAEYVANAIGANGLLCRVTTLYHDIGKMINPQYYTENYMLTGGKPFNIHQLLTPTESAYIIKSHVADGEALAKQHKLPQVFIDIITQHHGTTLIKYFYVKQLEELGEDKAQIDEDAFRYPGPKPQTKEAAIIMIADSVEAASRSLDDNSEEEIRKLVDRITADKFTDGQFDECPLTFRELNVVKQKLVEILKATHHLRIKYPESKGDEEKK